MMRARRKDTGELVEVLALTREGLALVAPPSDRSRGVLLDHALLDPDPWEASLREGFLAWTDASLAARPPGQERERGPGGS